jgi:L,D-transpeptidase catalytic domain/Putative peptidoglycan binding domain
MNRPRALSIPLLAVALVPATAQAQTTTPPPTTPPPTTPPAPAPEPVAGKASISVSRGLATKSMRYAAPFQQVVVRGRVRPYVAGEKVTLYVLRRGRVTKRIETALRSGGRYRVPVQLVKQGLFRLVVKHAGSPGQQAFKTKSKRVSVVDWQAGQGERGTKVLMLQRGLYRLGFSVPVTGYYDWLTANAVNAFRKTNGMGRDGYAKKSVYAKVLRGEGAYKLRYPKAGKGKPFRTYHTSSGTPATPTVFGTYRFYLQTPGTNSKGMVHSSYFIRGYAIHGYASVPNYPASHGCLRVPIPNAASIFSWIDIGDPIFLYK